MIHRSPPSGHFGQNVLVPWGAMKTAPETFVKKLPGPKPGTPYRPPLPTILKFGPPLKVIFSTFQMIWSRIFFFILVNWFFSVCRFYVHLFIIQLFDFQSFRDTWASSTQPGMNDLGSSWVCLHTRQQKNNYAQRTIDVVEWLFYTNTFAVCAATKYTSQLPFHAGMSC